MTMGARAAVLALATAYALVAFLPVVAATSSLVAKADDATLVNVQQKDDGGAGLSTPWLAVVHLGPLDYILEKVDEAYQQSKTEGYKCAYDTGSERDSFVCYCFNLDWSCQNTILDTWTCYMSAGPQTNNQVGIVCIPPRAAGNVR